MPSTSMSKRSIAASEPVRARSEPEMSQAEPPSNGPRRRALCVMTIVLAACSVLYELLAAQTLSSLAANTVTWYSVVIGTFLGAMGLGAFYCQRKGDAQSPWRALARVELALCVVGVLIVPAIHIGHMLHGYLEVNVGVYTARFAFFGAAFGSTALVGFLTGIELPLLMRAGERLSGERSTANLVLGLDYVGSLIGAIVFPLVLLPRMDLLSIGVATAAVNLLVASWLVFREEECEDGSFGLTTAMFGIAFGLLGVSLGSARIDTYFLRKYYYYHHTTDSLASLFAPMDEFPRVQRRRSPYQRIDLVEDTDKDVSQFLIPWFSDKLAVEEDFPLNYILFLNGDFQTNTTYEEVYHEYFAHVPIAARGEVPKRVLLLGGGDGFLLRELLKYDGIESILHVDIDPVLPELARTHPILKEVNRGAFDSPRLEKIRTDGFQFVRRSDREFDAIYIDFPVAVDYELSRLYSMEFFHFVRDRLADGGFAVFDSTGTSILTPPDENGDQQLVVGNDWQIYCNTLMAAGFPQIVPYLTTLDTSNQDAIDWLLQSNVEISVGQQFKAAYETAATDEERDALKTLLARQLLMQYAMSLQQGFVMLGKDDGVLDTKTWHDPGVELHLLDEEAFHRAFLVEFPFPAQPDPDLVNSILQPRFPTVPLWEPRKPF